MIFGSWMFQYFIIGYHTIYYIHVMALFKNEVMCTIIMQLPTKLEVTFENKSVWCKNIDQYFIQKWTCLSPLPLFYKLCYARLHYFINCTLSQREKTMCQYRFTD